MWDMGRAESRALLDSLRKVLFLFYEAQGKHGLKKETNTVCAVSLASEKASCLDTK